MSIEDRKRYGETILKVTAGARSVPISFCSSLWGRKTTKRRLTMMFDVKNEKKHWMITIASVCLIVAASTSTAVWASSHTPKVKEKPLKQCLYLTTLEKLPVKRLNSKLLLLGMRPLKLLLYLTAPERLPFRRLNPKLLNPGMRSPRLLLYPTDPEKLPFQRLNPE